MAEQRNNQTHIASSQRSAIIKGGYFHAPSQPAKPRRDTGTWGTPSPSTPQQEPQRSNNQ